MPILPKHLQLFALVLPFFAVCPSFAETAPRFLGRWEGTLIEGENALPFALRIAEDGMFLDVPSHNVFGYPVEGPELASGNEFAAILPTGSAEVRLEGTLGEAGIAGKLEVGDNEGSFSMVMTGPLEDRSTWHPIKTSEGITLHGDLLVPEGPGPFPLLVFCSGSGPTDRDGNSYAVPGRCDSLKQLAYELRARGVATYRYDKRGSGRAFFLAPGLDGFSFDSYVVDAAAVAGHFGALGGFASVSFAGHSEGALVATAAAARGGVDALILLAGTGRRADRLILDQIAASEPAPGVLSECEAIFKRLAEGGRVEEVSEELLGLFRPSVQGYLASWIALDPAEILASVSVPVLIVQGDADLQVTPEDTDLLRNAGKGSAFLMVEGMNHALKDVSSSPDDEWASYSDPTFPLGTGLAEGVANFALSVPARSAR